MEKIDITLDEVYDLYVKKNRMNIAPVDYCLTFSNFIEIQIKPKYRIL